MSTTNGLKIMNNHLVLNGQLILQSNLRRLMDHHRLKQADFRARGGAAQSTIGRLLHTDTAARVSTLCEIAKTFHLEAWQLLVPDLDPENPPVLQPMSLAEREWYERLRVAAEEIAATTRNTRLTSR